MKKIISFSPTSNYDSQIKQFLNKTTNTKVIFPSPIKTTNNYNLSICLPKKLNLNNFINGLKDESNIIFTTNGHCNYNYYLEISKIILNDLNHPKELYPLINKGKINIKETYQNLNKINPKLKLSKYLYYLFHMIISIKIIDKIDTIIRKNIGFEKIKNTNYNLKQDFLTDLEKENSILKLFLIYFKYKKLFKKIPIIKPKNTLKVAIIGELYIDIEPLSNYTLEKFLGNLNIEIKSYSNLHYLSKPNKLKKNIMLKKVKNYCKYPLNFNDLKNIYTTLNSINKAYDAVIFIKPLGCTKGAATIPIIQKICNQHKMPILFLSYGTKIKETRIKLEEFLNSIVRKKN